MAADVMNSGYSHVQRAPLALILYASAAGCFLLTGFVDDVAGRLISGGASLLPALLASGFHHLRVADRGDRLLIQFGPLPLFQRTVRYAEIESVEVGRTLLLDGWGIHWSIRGGWVWNIWGRACVVVHFRQGGTLRIGTDDAQKLAEFLRSRIGG